MKILFKLFLSLLISSSLYAETLIIGVSSFNPPMEMLANKKNNVFIGFEIDLLNEICRRINATCVYKPMTFLGIMRAVAAGEVNLGADGFFITQERLTQYLFSMPHLQTKAQLFANTNSNITSANINTGKRIGVEAGTVFKAILLKMYNNVQIISYDYQEDMLGDLTDRKIDLIMFDWVGASYWVRNSQGDFKLIGDPIPFGLGYGFMANLNEGPLISRMNNAIKAMEDDGTYLRIYSLYF